MKILNVLMVIIIIILCVISSLALISIHGSLIASNLHFSPSGINYYLSTYGPYKYLFTGTIATISAYFGLLRLKATLDSNLEKVKQDRFSEWKTIVQIRCNEIEWIDPKMTREIIKVRRPIFEYLFDRNFRIQDKVVLTNLFKENIAENVSFFEHTNLKYQRYGSVYPNNKYVYSFDSFRFIFFGMIENWYEGLIDDLEELYIENLPDERMISQARYEDAVQNGA